MDSGTLTELRWLHRLIGTWKVAGSCLMGADQPSGPFAGTEEVKPLGEFWIVAESDNTVLETGRKVQSVMTLGYDLYRKRFSGSWAGSQMPTLWVYSGFLDSEQEVLILETDGPSFERPGKTTKYRDLLTMPDIDSRNLQSFILARNGQWREFLTAAYQRN